MDLDQLLKQWEMDCEINLVDPGRESIKISSYHAKYIRVLSKAKLKLKQLNNEYAEMKLIKWHYYSGHYNSDKIKLQELGLEPFKIILKQDIVIYFNADKDLIDLTNKIAYYEEIISTCNQILSSLKNRSWDIRTYVDWKKFEEGN